MLPVRGQCRVRHVIDAAIPVQDHRDLVADRSREIQGRGRGRHIRAALRGGRQVYEQVGLAPGGGGEGLPGVEGENLCRPHYVEVGDTVSYKGRKLSSGIIFDGHNEVKLSRFWVNLRELSLTFIQLV